MFTCGLLLLGFLIAICDFGVRADSEDKCDPGQAEDYAQAARFANQSCLFEVWGIRKKVNVRQKGTDDFVLDSNLALAICQYHNATLPVIESEDKETFLLSLLEEEGACLLGLKRIGDRPVWDNGQELTYSNEDWRRTEAPCYYTLLVHHGSGASWEDVPCGATRLEHVLVFCEESYDQKIIPTQPITPPWDMHDKCDPMNEHKFRRVKKYEDGSCYFEVDGADEEANRPTNVKKNGISHFTFDVELARQTCNDYDATLPVLRSEEEEEWLLEFNGQNFDYVALGLHATSAGHGWDDGTPVTYSNPDWRQKSENGTSYTLLISSMAEEGHYWIDTPAEELIPNGVQIICKEEYDKVSMTRVNMVTSEFRKSELADATGPASKAETRVSSGKIPGRASSASSGYNEMGHLRLLAILSGVMLILCNSVTCRYV